jgi:hypothetical protein
VFLALLVTPGVAVAAQLTLSWTDNASDETGYRVERKIGSGGSYSEIAILAANSTSHTDPNLAAATTYCYRVRAFNTAGVSAYSNEACATTTQSTLNLTVTKSGTGSGTVVSLPSGINCGSDCSEAFPSGTVVTLTATASAGSRFDGWSGGGCSGTGPCTLTGNTNVAVTATFSTTTGASCPAGQFRAEYFNNTTLSGTPVLVRCEGPIRYDWGAGGPGSGVAADQFSVRWTGWFDFAAGTYLITARADDGVRVWVDGTQVIAGWRDQAATTYQATRTLTAGSHEVRMEYYESGGFAVASLGWQAQAVSSCPTGQFRAEYFNNTTLSGTPVLVRCEGPIRYDWGAGGPGSGVAADRFSVRWTGWFDFAAGTYLVTARADDGVRVWVDGTQVIAGWRDQAATTYQATRTLTAGSHEVRMEYYENGGFAVASLGWQAQAVSSCPTGQFRAEYFNNTTLSGTPVLVRCEGPIRYDWGAGGPGSGVAADRFSVRWTGWFDFAAGTYVVTARADDGVRVWVDGTQVIAGWRDQAATTYQATRTLTAGSHEVRMEYYENGGFAVASLGWQAQAVSSCPTGQFRAEYFNNTTLSGTPVLVRCEGPIRYDWGAGGPGSGVAADQFSVRWTGWFDFAAGTYVVTARADDGVRVWVDGTPLIDAWRVQAATTYQATRTLSGGQHDVRVEYYEGSGLAVVEIRW